MSLPNNQMQKTGHSIFIPIASVFARFRSGALDLKKQPSVDPTNMKDQTLKVVGLSPEREVMSQQRR